MSILKEKSFFKGLALGISIMLVVIIAHAFYVRNIRWGGIDPNRKVMEIYGLLNEHSILPFELDEMLESMYMGLLDGVADPYTQYFDADALASFRVRLEGSYVGIGVVVYVDPADRLVTVGVAYRGTPAYEAGITQGDKIVGINGVDVSTRPMEEIISLIRGQEGTSVTVTIFRPFDNTRFDAQLIRSHIEIPTVFHEMIYENGKSIGYILIEGFDQITPGQFVSALSELYDNGMNGLILDLRNNPGGSLGAVNRIADMLLPEGIITYLEDVNGERINHYSNATYLGLPLVVLVNGRSASASEVLSGAIRDTGVGTIVGTTTFGKGIVQNLFPLSDDTAVKMTTAKYFTPNGESIHGSGIVPHVVIEMEEILSRQIGSLEFDEDIQLQKAVEVILSKIN